MKDKSIKPKVTVYITNYNYGKFLTKAIDSILGQTFTDLELIIIDDGSNDNSHDIINNYSNLENVYTVFQKNRGLNASNNVALSLAQGEYIMRLDADDYLASQAIELMVLEMDRNLDCALIFPDYYNIDEGGNIIEEIKRHDFSKDVKLLDQPAHGACTLIRSKILKSIGGYDEEFNRQDGYDIWLKITELYRVKNISLPLFYYRQHSKSITKNEKMLFKARTKIINKNLNKKNVKPLKVLSIIPVRGESTDPSLKPLDNIGGKELINWTIECALKSSLLENLVVTGKDLKLKNFIKSNWGKKVIWIDRDKNLSAMNTGIENTAIAITKKYEKSYSKVDAVMMLYIEYPFRSSMYIDQAINVMQLFKVDSVSTVRKDDDMFFIHTGEGLKPWHRSKKLRLERDELYRRSGGLHLIRKEVLIKNKNMLYGKMGHVAIDKEAAFKVKSKNSYKYLDKLNIKK